MPSNVLGVPLVYCFHFPMFALSMSTLTAERDTISSGGHVALLPLSWLVCLLDVDNDGERIALCASLKKLCLKGVLHSATKLLGLSVAVLS